MTARSTTPSHPSTTTVAEGTLVWPLPGQSSRTSETALPLTITVASDSSAGANTHRAVSGLAQSSTVTSLWLLRTGGYTSSWKYFFRCSARGTLKLMGVTVSPDSFSTRATCGNDKKKREKRKYKEKDNKK